MSRINKVIAGQASSHQYRATASNVTVMAGSIHGLDGGVVIVGGAGNDRLYGGSGDDVLDGGAGNDMLNGGTGNDTYLFGIGSGQDTISARDKTAGKLDVIQLGAGIAPSDIVLRRFGYSLWLTIKGSADCLQVAAYFYAEASFGYQVEQIRFADGTIWDIETVKQLVTVGTEDNDELYGSPDADTLNGLAGNDMLDGKGGNDVIDGGAGFDRLYGGDGDDTLFGGSQGDELRGGAGADLLQGQDGDDHLFGGAGDDVLDGGSGNDVLNGGPGNGILIGGSGNDRISIGAGTDIIAFNRGDGQDTVIINRAKGNTLSLGHGIAYTDLLFSKKGDDLTLVTGTNEQITFKRWYLNANHHSVATLQMMIEDSADYDAASTSTINNKKITQFNFGGLVAAFDRARAETATLKNWALSSSMSDYHLGGSDTAAIGGDLAYQYARMGSLSSISLKPAQAILADAQFGRGNQHLLAASALQDGSLRLA